jgi:hypothetical protein
MKNKSGLAHSPFFTQVSGYRSGTIHPSKQIKGQESSKQKKDTPPPNSDSDVQSSTVIPRHHDTTIPSNHDTVIPRHHDTMTPRYHDTIRQVQNAIKKFGKEAATHRFTLEEKQAVAELIYNYKQKGIKTSENEIARIALNYLIANYHSQGEKSILAQVLSKAPQ